MATATASPQSSLRPATPNPRPTTSHSASSPRAALRPPTASPPTSSRHSSSSSKVSSRPASAPVSLLGYTSPVRTISPQIANFRPSTREIVKAIAPHVLDERKTRRRSPSRTGSSSWPGKPYHTVTHHHDRASRQHTRSHSNHPHHSWSEFAHRHAEKKKLKPSPLRVVAVICRDDTCSGSIDLRESRCCFPYVLLPPPTSLRINFSREIAVVFT